MRENISKLKDNWFEINKSWIAKRRMEDKTENDWRIKSRIGIKNVVSIKNKIVNLSIPNEAKNRLIGGLRNWKGSRKDGWIGKYKRKESRRWMGKEVVKIFSTFGFLSSV